MRAEFKSGFEKTAFLGIPLDIGLVGIPSAIGYYIGKNTALSTPKDELLKSEPGVLSKVLGYSFLPGYTGYRFGIEAGIDTKNDLEEEKLKKEKFLSSMQPGGLDPDDLFIEKLKGKYPSKDS